jgi:hypothetical protein
MRKIALALGGVLLLLASQAALAQEYPTRSIGDRNLAGDYCRERQALFSDTPLERWIDDLRVWEQRKAADRSEG